MDQTTILVIAFLTELLIILSLIFKIVLLEKRNAETLEDKEDLYKLYHALAKQLRGYMQEERL